MRKTTSLALAALLAGGCSDPAPTDTEGPQENLSIDSRLVNAYTGFSLKLFREISEEAGEKNVFLSPASVAFALSMTYNGAAGETQREMARALEVEGMSVEALNEANRAWRAALASPDRKVELAVANSLWGRQGTPFRADFLQRARDAYGAEVTALDFSSPGASRTINAWVARNTKDRIKEIVPAQIDPQTILYLINAIYFKGSWKDPFDPRLTRDGEWHLPSGSTRPHPMMQRTGNYGLLDGEGFTGVALPYGSGRMAMYLLLPDEGTSVGALARRLEAAEWERWMTGFQQQRIMLSLPRFRLEYEIGLVPTLKALGMEKAFDPRAADFSGMLPADFLARNNAYVSDVKHKTFVEVNELGTEAAGATSVEVGVTSMPPSVQVDRPFLVAIRDNGTGTVLFLGQIVDPGR